MHPFQHETNSIVCFSCLIRYANCIRIYVVNWWVNITIYLYRAAELRTATHRPYLLHQFEIGYEGRQMFIYLKRSIDCVLQRENFRYYFRFITVFRCINLRAIRLDAVTQWHSEIHSVNCDAAQDDVLFSINFYIEIPFPQADGQKKKKRKYVHTKSVAPKAIIVCFHIAWCNNLFIRFLL